MNESTEQFAHLQYLYIMKLMSMKQDDAQSLSLVMPCLDVKKFPLANADQSIKTIIARIETKNVLEIISFEHSVLTMKTKMKKLPAEKKSSIPKLMQKLKSKSESESESEFKLDHNASKLVRPIKKVKQSVQHIQNEYQVEQTQLQSSPLSQVQVEQSDVIDLDNSLHHVEADIEQNPKQLDDNVPKIKINLSHPDSWLKIQFYHLKRKLNQ